MHLNLIRYSDVRIYHFTSVAEVCVVNCLKRNIASNDDLE